MDELMERGMRVVQAIRDAKASLYEGQVVVVCRPKVLVGGSVSYKDIKAVVLKKYDNYFMVEDQIGEDWKHYKRKWCVSYTDLVCNRWYGRLRYQEES